MLIGVIQPRKLELQERAEVVGRRLFSKWEEWKRKNKWTDGSSTLRRQRRWEFM